MSSRRLQDVLEDVKLLRWRRVQDVFKTCLDGVFKTSSRPTNICWDVITTTKSAFKRAISWNKYYSKSGDKEPILYLDQMIETNFEGIRRIFLFFVGKSHRSRHIGYFLPKVKFQCQEWSEKIFRSTYYLRWYKNIWKYLKVSYCSTGWLSNW